MTYEEAVAAGSTRYWNGLPCRHGHIAERHVSSRNCVECHRAGGRRWRAKNPEKHRNMTRKCAGLPEALYPPPGYCEICKSASPGKFAWNLDHDHSTGRFRGWLCGQCNRALGYFKDSPEIMDAAATYVRKHRAN